MCMLKCVCVCVCMYACMYMYDVLVVIGERGRREGLKAGDKLRRESKLVLHEIVYGGTGMYPSWHI